ncbi:hypothetical protein ABPG75_007841 [Micractinium tetrahymenae]
MLTFSPGLEQSFCRRRNASLVQQDAAWAAFWTFMNLVGLVKWIQFDGKKDADLPPILVYVLVCPSILATIWLRPALYVRHRVAIIYAARIVRTYFFYKHIPYWLGVYTGSHGGAPTSAFKLAHHLAWGPASLATVCLGWITPLRFHIPWLLLLLGLQLHGTGQQCRIECAVGGGGAPAGACAALPGTPLAATAGATCWPAEGAWQHVQHVYSAALRLLQLAVPPAWRRLSATSCFASCYALHAWLQAAAGVLLPLALVWAWEERLRWRELSVHGGCSSRKQQPLRVSLLLAWSLGSAWALWLGLQGVLA